VGVVDALVSRILELGPVLLVVDDVQWADPASRAALAYLIAGFSRQRLALVTTHRDEDARGGEGFRTWVADMRRMPSVSVLQLDRLDREATRAQLTALLGARPGNGLVNQVFQRSQGNAYLTELLVSGMDPTAVTLPEGLPTALSEALLSAWHRLTLQARTLTRFLAVAGRPTAIATLRDVLIDLTGDDTLVGSLHEAVDAGIAVIEEANVWFRHPLLADVLIETFLPGESAPVHAAWARVLSRTSAAGLDEVRRLSALALHCEAAEDPRGAYDASIEAADLAEQHRELRDAARNLVRAAALWDDGAPDRDDMPALAALLERGATMCNRADQGPQAHALVTRALGVVDDGADPLRASRLLVEWTDLEWELGRTDEPLVEHVARAVELARTTPLSPEYAEALALLSIRLPWSRHEEAATLAEEAVAAARRSGSAKTLSAALGARAATSADVDRAGLDTEQALSCARTSGDDLCLGWAYVARANYLLRRGALGELIQVFREALDHAVEHGRGARESSNLADALLLVGDLPAAAEVVREGLPWSVKANDTVALRLSAAVLASRRGDRRLAEMHRTRAYEVMPSLERRVGATSTAAIAEILLARSEPEAALRLLHSVMPAAASDPAWLDELMVWGARAAADLVEAGDDARDPDIVTRARQRLADLVSLRATFPGTPYEPSCDTDPVQPAMGALFEAERGRSTGEGDLIELWRQAAAACQRAGLLWDHHQALWRLGVEFVRQHAPSAEAAAPLRAAHRYALEQGAVPFLHRVEETAALGRISLTEPVTPSRRAGSPAAFAQLTDRETEILAHLVANRTNAEIATELVISEKTVSVHVSNLLRKTSTGSRREVAALAVRLGWGSADAAG
jgi:DNA-binding CsgD family transcriptional regulator/tetratricopeptide (TPR) repeat protein